MHSHRLLLPLTALIFLCGCKALNSESEEKQKISDASQSEKPANYRQHLRNNAVSLLYDLLNDEKNLSKILIIKRGTDALHRLVKQISTTADVEVNQLEQIAQSDPLLDLHVMGLPSGEVATRDAVSKTKQHELLHSKGDEFEFKLLLTQVEALNYGAHLAKVAAANELNAGNARVLNGIQNDLGTLYRETCEQLRR